MFVLLTRLLLWLLIIVLAFYLITRFIPEKFLKLLGLLVLATFIILAFIEPTLEEAAIAWKILSFPLSPLGLVLVLLANAINKTVFAKKSKSKDCKEDGGEKGGQGVGMYLIPAFLILFFLSVPVVSYRLADRFEREAALFRLRPVEGASAIVLVGWNTTQPSVGDPGGVQLSDRGDSILFAARLYRQGAAPFVVVSAGPRSGISIGEDDEAEDIEAEDIGILLNNLGVPSDRIIVEPRGVSLRTTAVQVRDILVDLNLNDRVILVAPAIYSYRAARTFAQLGISITLRPTDFISVPILEGDEFDLDISDLVPRPEALALSTEVIDEYLANIYYFLRGWMTPQEFCRDCNDIEAIE